MILQRKRIFGIIGSVLLLLFIPLVAMQFSNEVNWTLFDFVVAGILLLATGSAVDFVSRKIKPSYRLAVYAIIIVSLLLIWAELAVGIFGTPFAGS